MSRYVEFRRKRCVRQSGIRSLVCELQIGQDIWGGASATHRHREANVR
jgi:hypothetical protein